MCVAEDLAAGVRIKFDLENVGGLEWTEDGWRCWAFRTIGRLGGIPQASVAGKQCFCAAYAPSLRNVHCFAPVSPKAKWIVPPSKLSPEHALALPEVPEKLGETLEALCGATEQAVDAVLL